MLITKLRKFKTRYIDKKIYRNLKISDGSVTMVMPLKDRPECTRRLINELEREKFVYQILIADGGKDKKIEKLLSQKRIGKNLNYKYYRYPYDKNLKTFYQKMVNILNEVKTDYCFLMDDDDFIYPSGIERCIGILKAGNFYISARGAISTNKDKNIYAKYKESIIGDSGLVRLNKQARFWHGNFHNIYKTNYLRATWGVINIVSPYNYRIVDQLTGFLPAIYGNILRGEFLFLFKCHDERIKTENGFLQSHLPSQEVWLNSDYWEIEFNKLCHAVIASVQFVDDCNFENALKSFQESYIMRFEKSLWDLANFKINNSNKLNFDENKIDRIKRLLGSTLIK